MLNTYVYQLEDLFIMNLFSIFILSFWITFKFSSKDYVPGMFFGVTDFKQFEILKTLDLNSIIGFIRITKYRIHVCNSDKVYMSH